MSRSFFVTITAALAGLTACAAPRYAEPNRPVAKSIGLPATQDAGQRAVPGAADSEATRAWFDREIERARYVPPPPPVETRIVYERVPVQYDEYYVSQPDCRYDDPCDGPRFPVNTAVGAGLGAIIGHQSGHRDEGAAIGAGIGLLFDLARW